MCPHPREYDVDEVSNHPNSMTDDFESVSESLASSVPSEKTIIFQGTHKVLKSDSLFYTTATIAGVSLAAMIDSGSTECTLSESAMAQLLVCNPDMKRYPADDVVIVGCGGHQVTPSAICDVEMVVQVSCAYVCSAWTDR